MTLRLDDRYELGPRAGRGGMGTVHRGIDLLTGATVAIKLVEGVAGESAARFEREAQSLAALDHPNIVRHLGHGRLGDGRGYLVMEWLQGVTLDAHLDAGPLPTREVLQIAAHLVRALVATHAVGLVHRDLKPTNVMLVDARPGDVRLIDFGIARQAGATPITQAGVVMGTPGFMAPEQIRGAGPVDGRADLYALGALIFVALTGRMPFVAETTPAMLVRALLEPAPRLSTLLPRIPPALDDFVASLLEAAAERRPESARRVGERVDALLSLTALETPEGGAANSGLAGAERLMHACLFVVDPSLGPPEAAPDAPAPSTPRPSAGTPGGGAPDDTAPLSTVSGAVLSVEIEAMSARDHALESCALRFGGEVERTGLATRAIHFVGLGAPGDEARRAVRCAGALREQLGPLALSLRIVRVQSGPAQRLEATPEPPAGAGGGEEPLHDVEHLRLDDTAARLLEGRYGIDRDTDGPLIRRLVPLSAPSRRIVGRQLPFVGRERELLLLQSFFEDAVEASAPRVVLVTGPAGQGKSGLLRVFLDRVATLPEPPLVWRGQADPLDAGVPYALFQRVLGSAAAPEPTPEPADEPSSPGTALREGCEAQLVALCSTDAAARPLLLALDDLHWADVPSIRALDAFLRSMAGRPVLVVGLARPDLDEAFPRLFAQRVPHRIALGELAPRSALALVHAALGDQLEPEAAQALVARAAGNVFCLEELIRAVADGRGETLPESVLALVQARLLTLELPARRLLRLASLLGERFSGGALGQLAAVGDQTLDASLWLRALVEREILLPDTGARPGEQGWRFAHALVRDAAYELFTPEDRRRAHRQAATLLTAAPRPDAVRIAHHLMASESPTEAADWLARAAEHALRVSDPAAARKHAERALELGGASLGEATQAELRAMAGEAARLLGDAAAARAHLGLALASLVPGSPAWYAAQRTAVLVGMTDLYRPR